MVCKSTMFFLSLKILLLKNLLFLSIIADRSVYAVFLLLLQLQKHTIRYGMFLYNLFFYLKKSIVFLLQQ